MSLGRKNENLDLAFEVCFIQSTVYKEVGVTFKVYLLLPFYIMLLYWYLGDGLYE